MKNADYLGDGVYAFFDGFGIELRTERESGTHTIYLEDTVLAALNRFAERMGRPTTHGADSLRCHGCGYTDGDHAVWCPVE